MLCRKWKTIKTHEKLKRKHDFDKRQGNRETKNKGS